MKNLLILFALFCNLSYSQTKTFVKFSTDSTGTYEIKYSLENEFLFYPSTVNSIPHYNAIISVYKRNKKTGKKDLVGNKINGIYVRGGCFEDDPHKWISIAKENNTAIVSLDTMKYFQPSQPTLFITNYTKLIDTTKIVMLICDTTAKDGRVDWIHGYKISKYHTINRYSYPSLDSFDYYDDKIKLLNNKIIWLTINIK